LDVNQKKPGKVTFNSQESISVKTRLGTGRGRVSQGSREVVQVLPTAGQHGKDFTQSLANVFQLRSGARRERQRGLFFVSLDFCPKMLACAGNGKSLFVKKFLDAQNAFDVFMPVHSLSGAAFDWLELGKFSFPEAQNVGRQAAEASDFANAKVKFLWDHHIGGPGGLGDGSGAQAHRGSGNDAGRGKIRISPPEFLARPGFWHNPDFQTGAFWGKIR
jgi:hypothetical protein